MAARKRVLIVQPVHPAGVALLEPDFEVRVATDPSAPTLRREVGGASALLVRTAPIGADVIDAAPGLEVIARHGVGVDNIDVAAATRRGIPVAYTPEANAVSVAEHAILLMAAVARRLLAYDAAARRGDWALRDRYAAVELDGKTLGVVGVGRIGRLVARKAKGAFGMRVLGHDPLLPPEAIAEAGLEPVGALEDLLPVVDVLSLHVPLTRETRGLVGAAALARMRPSAVLLNTSRGGVVDEAALCEALAGGRLAGAGLDVFEEEPVPAGHPLLRLPNVVVTPHSAALTAECVVRMATGAAQAIADVLRGRRPAHVVNPEVFGRQPGAGEG